MTGYENVLSEISLYEHLTKNIQAIEAAVAGIEAGKSFCFDLVANDLEYTKASVNVSADTALPLIRGALDAMKARVADIKARLDVCASTIQSAA